MRTSSYLALLSFLLLGNFACAADVSEPMSDRDGDRTGGKADDGRGGVDAIGLYNPLGLERPLAYVDRMHASLLSEELDTLDFDGDRAEVLRKLDTAEQAYLMMALAGMEYYPVTEVGEADLDRTLKNVVETGSPEGGGAPTGLQLVDTVQRRGLGFRADVVRVKDRPHYVVAIRGTQIKQPRFVESFSNGLADLSTAAIEVSHRDILSADFSSNDPVQALRGLIDVKRSIIPALRRTEFNHRKTVAHAGIYLSASIVHGTSDLDDDGGVHDSLVSQLELEFEDAERRPCVWITGHSLGGGMAPLIAYRLSQSRAFTTRARICGVYTYGAPRVANGLHPELWRNRGLVGAYNETPIADGADLDLGSVTFRYQLKDDVIPHLPPNIPFNDSGEVSELVAEVLMAVVRTYAEDILRVEQIKDGATDKLEALGERETLVAQAIFGAGDFLHDVYRMMKEEGAIDAIEGAAYQAAKERVVDLVYRFRGLQHLGHTRYIDRPSEGSFRMVSGSASQAHHLEWMLSFVEKLRGAVCADRADGSNSHVQRHVLNSLGFHRVPNYAAVLLMHTNHAEGDGRFSYPEGSVNDRLEAGLTFYSLPDFETRLERMYDEEQRTYLSCD